MRLPAISWPSSAPRQLSKSAQCNCARRRDTGHFGRAAPDIARQTVFKKQKQISPAGTDGSARRVEAWIAAAGKRGQRTAVSIAHGCDMVLIELKRLLIELSI
jgi:hypothetical protein